MFIQEIQERLDYAADKAKMNYTYGMDLIWLDKCIQVTVQQLMTSISHYQCEGGEVAKIEKESLERDVSKIKKNLEHLLTMLETDSNHVLEDDFLGAFIRLNSKQARCANSFEILLVDIYRALLVYGHPGDTPWKLTSYRRMGQPGYIANGYHVGEGEDYNKKVIRY